MDVRSRLEVRVAANKPDAVAHVAGTKADVM